MGAWIAERLNRCDGEVRFLIPEKGVSAIDAPGQPFHDPEADAALFDGAGSGVQADRQAPADPAAAPHQRSGLLRRAGREFPRDRRLRRKAMPRIERSKILEKFQDMVRRGVPIVGGGAGTGLSAKCEEAGGIDLIIIYNSGRYRMAGRGSAAGLLAYGNANEIVKEMAVEVLPVVKHTPVLAGVNGTDPFVLMEQFLAELKAMGFSGVQNFPTIGLFDGVMRASFEETGMGYGLEVDMIARGARARPADHALRLQPGRGGGDDQGRRRHHRRAYGRHRPAARSAPLRRRRSTNASARSTRSPRRRSSVRKDVIVLCHGGPIAMPDDAAFILQHCRALPWLLRRVEHGAAAGGDGAHRTDAQLQGDRDEARLKRRQRHEQRGGRDGRQVRDRQGDQAGSARLGPARLDEQSAQYRREAAHRHRRDADARQGPRLSQAPRPGRGDLLRRRQGRAMGRPRAARARRRATAPSSRPTWCMPRSMSATATPRSSRSSDPASARSATSWSTWRARRRGRICGSEAEGRCRGRTPPSVVIAGLDPASHSVTVSRCVPEWMPGQAGHDDVRDEAYGPSQKRRRTEETMANTYPKLHNAMWPGVVGKGAPTPSRSSRSTRCSS